MTATLDIAALASAILYPLALVIIFLLFRKEIPAIAKSIAGRLTKLEVVVISLELAQNSSFDKIEAKESALDFRHRVGSIDVNNSTAENFRSKLKAKGVMD